ncbi:MAG: Ribose ABC transport system, permease protein RbsC [uncultured Thermomicrobiales bacterium]|uniref:Ribose ABC transport system, permease protein RbsC n=1 Tax=uncultured Thermomicrobiales bacterium TaxID=1645740 RepID=A0A6J4U8Z2_9BACT|nr:MAG: Ribose ABC transport system, permease protein RbsC [uncultured Thermomicrobiales bacterium]
MAQGIPQPIGAPAGERRASGDLGNRVLRLASRNARLIAPLTTLIALFVFFSLVTDVFLSTRNFQNIVSQIGPVAVAACGITFVLLCAEIDLSIASVATFTGVLSAYIFGNSWEMFGITLNLGVWGVLVAAIVAAGIGLLNGFFVAYVGIPSFMMTLAMLTIAAGMAEYVTKGRILPAASVPGELQDLASAGNRFLGIPYIGIVALAVLIVSDVVLSYTKFGRYVYMTGGNREAAEMSGVNTRRVVMLSLMVAGFTAGLAGMLFTGRLHNANPAGGTELLIQTIAAVVLGGTSLFGGEGGIKNTFIGLLIFGILSNGLNLIEGLSIHFKDALEGIILVGALLLNVLALRLERVQTRAD